MTEEEFALLAAGAALGALGPEDREAFRRAIAEHPEWADRADEDAVTAASLGDLVDDVPPPPALRARILADIDNAADATPVSSSASSEPGQDAARSTATRRARPTRRRWFALAASVVLVAGIATGTVIAVQQAQPPAAVVALERIESAPDAQQATAIVAGGGPATLHWSASEGKAVLVTRSMPAIPEDKTFELWYVRGETAIPAGTFDASGAKTTTELEPGMQPGDVIAVTVEASGGSPSRTPTTHPILAIPTT